MPPSAVLTLISLTAIGVLLHSWPWIKALPESAAAFVGAMAGGAIGLLAILAGALYNAHLNRKRDDRLRDQERAVLTESLRAEVQTIRDNLSGFLKSLRRNRVDKKLPDDFTTAHASVLRQLLRFANSGIFSSNAHRIGLMENPYLAFTLVNLYGQIGWFIEALNRMQQSEKIDAREHIEKVGPSILDVANTALSEMSKHPAER